jgi:hypothetical protein
MSRQNRTRPATAAPAVKATAGVAICMAGLAGCGRAEPQPAAPPATTSGALDRTILPVVPPARAASTEIDARKAKLPEIARGTGRLLCAGAAIQEAFPMISGYGGKSDAFDKAIRRFAKAYADQNEKDHAGLDRAVKKGTLKADFEEEG